MTTASGRQGGAFDPAARAVHHAESLMSKGYAQTDVLPMLETIGASLRARHALNLADECSWCPSMTTCKVKGRGFGNMAAPVMIVNSLASEDDTRYGQAMTGEEGFLLTLILRRMGVERNMVYVTNLVKCWDANTRPGTEEVENCIVHLAHELQWIRPSVIIALGQLAGSYLLEKPELRMPAGRGTWGEFGGTPVVVTHDLRYILAQTGDRVARAKNDLWNDFNTAFAQAHTLRPGAVFHTEANPNYSWTTQKAKVS